MNIARYANRCQCVLNKVYTQRTPLTSPNVNKAFQIKCYSGEFLNDFPSSELPYKNERRNTGNAFEGRNTWASSHENTDINHGIGRNVMFENNVRLTGRLVREPRVLTDINGNIKGILMLLTGKWRDDNSQPWIQLRTFSKGMAQHIKKNCTINDKVMITGELVNHRNSQDGNETTAVKITSISKMNGADSFSEDTETEI